MDISAILPVNMGNETSSLNDDFSGQTAAGDNIFSKPMGAKTYFRTETGGLVGVSFMFDPKKPYGDDHHMASVTSDWMADMRDALLRHLLDAKDIAPKLKSLEETIWDQLTQLLPKETIAKNLFADKTAFQAYTAMIKSTVEKTYTEESKLTDALIEKKFSFSFEIAIDAYPSALGGNNEKRVNEPKTGVLTFHMEGIPDGKMPEPEKTEDTEEKGDDANRKSKKRKKDDTDSASSGKEKKSKNKEAKELLKDLQLTECFNRAHIEHLKHFPPTAATFFDMVNRWFSSVVSRRATKLEKSRNRNPLYH